MREFERINAYKQDKFNQKREKYGLIYQNYEKYGSIWKKLLTKGGENRILYYVHFTDEMIGTNRENMGKERKILSLKQNSYARRL